MKRIVALTCTMLICAATFAQNERLPFGLKTSYTVNKSYSETVKGPGGSGSQFFDDFEGDTYQLSDKWEILRSNALDLQVTAPASTPKWFHCTSQSFNGNGANYIKYGQGSAAISFTAADFTWLISLDTIAISTDSETFLKFWLWYYSNYEQNYVTHFYVMAYDVDAQQLDTLLYLGKDSSSSLPNQYKSLVNLSLNKVAGKNIRLAFVYENRNNQNMGTQLAIDNVTITNINIPDIELNAIPYKYSKIPKSTFDSLMIDVKANIYNLGSTLTDELTVTSSCPKIPDYQSTSKVTDTIESGEQRLLVLNGKLTLRPNPDNYVIQLSATAQSDTITANNTDITSIEISNSIYATDRGIKGGIAFGPYSKVGNLYEFYKRCFINGIQIQWASTTSAPESQYPFSFTIQVLEVNPANPNVSRLVLTENKLKDYSALGGTIDYFLDSPVYCYPGFSYFILIVQNSDLPLGIGYDGNPNGSFWKVEDYYPLNAVKMANQSIGNLAIRALTSEPADNPTIFFNIKNTQREPAQNVKVKIVELDSTLTTNAQGHASIKLNNGRYTYWIDSTGYSSIEKKFTVFNQDLVINDLLVKAYLVKFRIMDADSTPLANAKILAYPFTLTTNSNGEDSTYMPSGSYDLHVLLSGYKMRDMVSLDIEDKDTVYNIIMEPATTYNLTVNVMNSKDEVLGNATVNLVGYGNLNTNSAGTCTFNGVLPGMVMGSAWATKYLEGFIFMNLQSDSTVTLNLTPEHYYATFYVSSKGLPVINAQIIIEGIDTVNTGLNGYAISDMIPFAKGIPFRVKYKEYHTYTSTFDLWDSNALVTVNLTPLGISDGLQQSCPEVFPNPVSDYININGIESFTLLIFDINGRMVYRNDNPENRVDISLLDKGIYVVKLVSQKGISTHKIVKY